MDINFSSGEDYQGSGISTGIARGIVGYFRGEDITREGLGMGAIAFRKGIFVYFPIVLSTRNISDVHIIKRFSVSRRLLKSIQGKPNLFVSVLSELAVKLYMASPLLQKTVLNLRLFQILKKTMKAGSFLKDVPSLAEAVFEYKILDNKISVHGKIDSLDGFLPSIFLMNEFSAAFFNKGLVRDQVVAPPSGWEKLPKDEGIPWLYSEKTRLCFQAGNFSSTPEVSAKALWGMENAGELCWAGFEYELNLRRLKIKSISIQYDVNFKEIEKS
jgi:hypothetical protein